MFKIGDLVTIINDVNHYIYKIVEISLKIKIVGYSYRLIRYVEEHEIKLASEEEISKENNKNNKLHQQITSVRLAKNKALFGRILHIDGDEAYLQSCLTLYKEMGLFAEGLYLSEKEIALGIEKVLLTITPDIIVITGHDAYNGKDKGLLENYENSESFIKAIRTIRKHFGLDEIVIIAGACGSHFEALIGNGANFASSPGRINTHTYDPAIVAIKVATTSINKIIDFNSVLKYIENGKEALGGIETRGKMRLLL